MTKKKTIKDANYRKNVAVQDERGIIDYDPDKMKDVVGGEKFSYDEYIAIQKESEGKVRGSFQLCYYTIPLSFKGQIDRCTDSKICFKRIYVDGMYPDGLCFDGKEDHVWMDRKGFEQFNPGDSVSFWAEIYRYLKTGNGKIIDFGLRNPKQIKKIEPYELPSDEDLIKQELSMMICETCMLSDSCPGPGLCLLPKGAKKKQVDSMYKFLKKSEENKQ